MSKKFIALFIVAMLAIAGLAVAPAVVSATQHEHNPVRICHATPPDTAAQGYVNITIDDDAVASGQGGHATEHNKDIIPPFHYWQKHGQQWQYLFFPGKNWDAAGQAIWNNGCAVPPPPPVDVCPNLDGVQESIPAGMILDANGNCVLPPPPPVDVCPNIDGVQTSVPAGMILDANGNCVLPPPPPVDVCPNIGGVQTSIPAGMVKDKNGNCVKDPGNPTPVPPPPPAQWFPGQPVCEVYNADFAQNIPMFFGPVGTPPANNRVTGYNAPEPQKRAIGITNGEGQYYVQSADGKIQHIYTAKATSYGFSCTEAATQTATIVEMCPNGKPIEWGAGIQPANKVLRITLGCDPNTAINVDGVVTNYVLSGGVTYFALTGTGNISVTIAGKTLSFHVAFGPGPLTATKL